MGQTFYTTYGSGVALQIGGAEVIVDISTMGHARAEAMTVDGRHVLLSDEQIADAEDVFERRLHADVPEVW